MSRNVPLTSQLGCNLPTKDRNLPDCLPPELVDRHNSYRRWHERHNSIKTKLTLRKKCPNTEFFLFCFYMISGKHIKKPIFRWFIHSGLKKVLGTSLMAPEAYLRPFQTSTMKASWKTSKRQISEDEKYYFFGKFCVCTMTSRMTCYLPFKNLKKKPSMPPQYLNFSSFWVRIQWVSLNTITTEKCPNTALFLVRIFLYPDKK